MQDTLKEIHSIMSRLPASPNVIVAGGCAVDVLNNRIPKDVDVFCFGINPSTFNMIVNYSARYNTITELGGEGYHGTGLIVKEFVSNGVTFQFVHDMYATTEEEVLNKFPLPHTKMSMKTFSLTSRHVAVNFSHTRESALANKSRCVWSPEDFDWESRYGIRQRQKIIDLRYHRVDSPMVALDVLLGLHKVGV